jgi:hypothetical protein
MRAISGKKISLQLETRIIAMRPRAAPRRSRVSRARRADPCAPIAERCRTPRRAMASVTERRKSRPSNQNAPRRAIELRVDTGASRRDGRCRTRRRDHRGAANATSKAAELRA